MQPQRTQVPPSPSRSTTATDIPSWAQRMAPTYPAGPPPMKITSYEAISSIRLECRINLAARRGGLTARRAGEEVREEHRYETGGRSAMMRHLVPRTQHLEPPA